MALEVYKLAKNNRSATGGYVIVTIEIFPEHMDMTSFTEDPCEYKHSLINDFYFPYKINMGKITRVSSLDETCEFPNAFVYPNNKPLKLERDKYFKIKHYKYSGFTTVDKDYLTVFKHKASVLNLSGYVDKKFTGVNFKFNTIGKLENKCYYKDGKLITVHSYYNNAFNTLRAVTQFVNDLKTSQCLYDELENLVTQHFFNTDGTIQSSSNYSTNKHTIPVYNVDLPNSAAKKRKIDTLPKLHIN